MIRRSLLALFAFLWMPLLPGCGLEALVAVTLGGAPHGPPPVLPRVDIAGNVTIADPFHSLWAQSPNLVFWDGQGGVVQPAAIRVDAGGAFAAAMPAGNGYNHLRAVAQAGPVDLMAIVPQANPGDSIVLGAPIDALTTAESLMAEALGRLVTFKEGGMPAQITLSAVPGASLDPLLAAQGVLARAVQPGGQGVPLAELVARAAGEALHANSNAPLFGTVRLGGDGKPTGVLGPQAMADIDAGKIQLDVGGPDGVPDGVVDTSAEAEAAFDAALDQAIAGLSIRVCLDPGLIRTVIAVNFNAGTRDGNCAPIDRYKWLDPKQIDHDARSVFFTGGVHPDSPIQDPALMQLLGNWVPNVIPMYDDGTHGDEKAGDNIWTITFDLPVGLRIGYKYTYGSTGEGWTGTEEWPGNQRLLQIVDVNGDGLVARLDNFGDETSNKDKANQRLPSNGGLGSISWHTDADGDGIPDCEEQPIDPAGGCKPSLWWTPPVEIISAACPVP